MAGKGKLKADGFLEAVLETLGALVVVMDRDGRIVHWNRACQETTGYTLAEVRGSHVWDRLLVPEETDGVKRVFKELQAGFFPNKHNNFWIAKDGARRTIAWSNTALLDAHGLVQYVIGTGIDMTREGELAEELKRSEHLASIATVVAGIAHEIRNPLNTAQLQMTILNRQLSRPGLPDTAGARKTSDAVRTEMERIAALARDFLEFAKPRKIHRSTVDLCMLARDVIRLCMPEAEAGGVSLGVDGPEKLMAHVDQGGIKQVLLNLVRNAYEVAPSGGQVRVRLSADNETVMIRVEDDGPGIQAPVNRLFEPFFTTKENGTGLGLSVTYGLVTDHGGDISVESNPGRTVFAVSLPARPSQV